MGGGPEASYRGRRRIRTTGSAIGEACSPRRYPRLLTLSGTLECASESASDRLRRDLRSPIRCPKQGERRCAEFRSLRCPPQPHTATLVTVPRHLVPAFKKKCAYVKERYWMKTCQDVSRGLAKQITDNRFLQRAGVIFLFSSVLCELLVAARAEHNEHPPTHTHTRVLNRVDLVGRLW